MAETVRQTIKHGASLQARGWAGPRNQSLQTGMNTEFPCRLERPWCAATDRGEELSPSKDKLCQALLFFPHASQPAPATAGPRTQYAGSLSLHGSRSRRAPAAPQVPPTSDERIQGHSLFVGKEKKEKKKRKRWRGAHPPPFVLGRSQDKLLRRSDWLEGEFW